MATQSIHKVLDRLFVDQSDGKVLRLVKFFLFDRGIPVLVLENNGGHACASVLPRYCDPIDVHEVTPSTCPSVSATSAVDTFSPFQRKVSPA